MTIEKPQVDTSVSRDSSKCTVCNDTGFEIFETPAPREIYGEVNWTTSYVKPCWKCAGKLRATDDLTGVPDEYREADASKFKFDSYHVDISNIKKLANSFVRDFKKWQLNGKGLYLWSSTSGSGKTFLACCLAKSVMIKYNLQMRFITAPDYMDKCSERMKAERGDYDVTEVYKHCEVLVLDDIGAQMDKQWQQQEMFKLINARNSKGLVTIYTSNYSISKLNLNERTQDRIFKGAIEIQMPEESIRTQKAVSEQDTFINDLGLGD